MSQPHLPRKGILNEGESQESPSPGRRIFTYHQKIVNQIIGGMFFQFHRVHFDAQRESKLKTGWVVCYRDSCHNYFIEIKFRNKCVSKDRFKCFGFIKLMWFLFVLSNQST